MVPHNQHQIIQVGRFVFLYVLFSRISFEKDINPFARRFGRPDQIGPLVEIISTSFRFDKWSRPD